MSGKKFSLSGKPCKRGHYAERDSQRRCKECIKLYNEKRYKEHKEDIQASNKNSYIKYRADRLSRSKKWAANNKERSRAIKRKCELAHKEEYLNKDKEYQRMKRQGPLFRVNKAIAKQIWQYMKTNKANKKWETLVGYDFDELKNRLESLFSIGMSWDNYGTYWEIDHIKPISLFLDGDVKDIWALNNLQPKTCFENRSKGNRCIG